MPFCASCGAQVEGRFCPKCGAPVAAGGAVPPPPPGPNPYVASPISAPMADNVAAALCYGLWLVTGIIFLVIEPYNRNRTIRFHAFQSIFASVAFLIIDVVLHVFFNVMIAMLGFFGVLAGIVFPIFGLACFLLWLYMMYSAYTGKTVVLPIIGPLAQKQAQA